MNTTASHTVGPRLMSARPVAVLQLSLTCGHIVTAVVDGPVPAGIACCERLGGQHIGQRFFPAAALVEHVARYGQRTVIRPVCAGPEPLLVLDRTERTSAPVNTHPVVAASAA
ncbi:hypothetical protein [Catellatospora chokoriensis]|uniref:Uncharacterized protein n=1 Tax=Catellatospora chokoriensis TaxID=310353 RepID=A0A8J3KDL5_9ACTN|nr:hypothetical protein [Catellatospora chokoriensis]GIF94024.1 hypothetical protein Cch02nite_74680 [Catellatospora chokoriensis]